jgi:hypothetical protein
VKPSPNAEPVTEEGRAQQGIPRRPEADRSGIVPRSA